MNAQEERELIDAIRNAPDSAWLAAMNAMDCHLWKTEPQAWRDMVGE